MVRSFLNRKDANIQVYTIKMMVVAQTDLNEYVWSMLYTLYSTSILKYAIECIRFKYKQETGTNIV